MSDTRAEAEEELETVEMSGNLEDSLGSALESSFNLPPPPPPPAKGSESAHEPTAIPDETVAATAEPIEGMAEWKDTLEGYTKEWQAESSIAREKALKTRQRIEKENADAEKKIKEELEKGKKSKLAEEKKKRDEQRLKEELEGEAESKKGSHGGDREKKVKEAWELVGDKKDNNTPTAETDVRGPTGKEQSKKEASKPLSYDPTRSTDPIPPIFQDPVPASQTTAPTESATLSRHSATSGAWEELSRGSPSGSSGEEVSRPQSNSEESDIVNIPSSSSKRGDDHQPQPPSQPPSLTLSLFNPSQLTFRRVLAVIGINLVLPFVNGVFLGFGEIFAREVVRVGKLVWKGERTWFGLGRGAAGRGTSGVGLSGGF
ncbi:hypothetical protein L486_00842 [Kwoniella mangroviensis CBS 10435]|uniref:Mitochondrial import protein 1 n=1 Tax=Kwoniella mangroviensis CBS 10435 TaxID=1331196 RepID=A0A1B9J093_9TREE|nr:hypothetical protein L486_00842 [Kwoniella mangroviensis CBS 10435]